jgi:hypothetical protein
MTRITRLRTTCTPTGKSHEADQRGALVGPGENIVTGRDQGVKSSHQAANRRYSDEARSSSLFP